LTSEGELSPASEDSKCHIITSGYACWEPKCRGFEATRAFDYGKSGFWGGRKSNGIFFIGLTCDMPDMAITGVTLKQRSVNTASTVKVQKLDQFQIWTDVATATQVDQNQEVVLYGTNLRRSGWRIVATTSSSGFAWDVVRVKFLLGEYIGRRDDQILTSEGELSPDSQCLMVTSSDYQRKFKGDNAFDDKKKSYWRGRKSDGMFYIGLTCDMADMPITAVTLKQRAVHNTASTVTVQKLDPFQRWTDVATTSIQAHPDKTTILYASNDRRLTTEFVMV